MRSTKQGVRPGMKLEPANGVEVLEKDTETAWAMFQSLLDQHQQGFSETAPAGAEVSATPPGPAAATLDATLLEIRRNNRVCPLPSIWKQLHDALPAKSPKLAPVPLTSQEWKQTPALEKRTRLRQHVEWAAAHGALQQVHDLLAALPENKWQHMGD